MKELLSIVNLTRAFSLLPSIGEKTAERMAYAVLEMDEEKVEFLLESIKNVRERVHHCPNCGALIDTDSCPYCGPSRDHKTCIVVSFPKDIMIFEKMDLKYTYHCLGGEINSLKGVTIKDIDFDKLFERIKKERIEEIIIATNPTIEGETTALYLAKLLEGSNVTVSRLGRGLPVGGKLEYSDSLTLTKSLENRTQYNKK